MRPLLLVLALAAAGVALVLLFRGASEAPVEPESRGAPPPPAESARGPADDAAAAASARAPEPRLETPSEEGVEVPSCAVRGSVRLADGRPAVRAYVWTDVAGAAVETESGEDGGFTLRLPAGTFELRARHEGTGTARAAVVVPRGEGAVDGPTLRLDAGARIRGRVFRSGGEPAPGMRVRATASDGSAVEFYTASGTRVRFGGDDVLTDAAGSFELKGLEPDVPHSVRVDGRLGADLDVEPDRIDDVLPDGPPLVFTLTGGRSIEGRVVDAASGEPIPSFRVAGLPVEDEEGRFDVALPSRGAVRFEAPGYLPVERDDLDLASGEARRGLVVPLARRASGGEWKVTVRDDAGRPVETFTLRARHAPGETWSRTFEHRSDGAASIDGLEPGAHVLEVLAGGHATAEVRVTIEAGTTVDSHVVLRRGADVRLVVLDEDGGPFTGDIALEDAEGRGPAWRFLPARSRGTLLRLSEASFPAGDGPSRGHLSPAEGTIVGLGAGVYVLSVHYGAEPTRRTFEVFPSTAVDLVVRP